MAYELKDMSGSLWKNDRKETDSHPNAKGTVKIEGVEYWVDAWTNTTNGGDKYQSLKFKRKDQQSGGATGATTQRPAPAGFDDLDDDVPFLTASADLEWRVG